MVTIRVHRHAVEVLTKAPVQAQTSRQEVEAAFVDDGSGGTVDVHRHAVETLSAAPVQSSLSRQELEAAFVDDGSGGTVDIHRHAVEVLVKMLAQVQVSRQEVEAAFADAGSGAPVLVHRQGIEVLARPGVPAPTPLPFPAGLDFFLHNWVSQMTLETSYRTDITRSPTTLAEERRALLQRPGRQVGLSLLQGTKSELDRLLVYLRRLTRDRLVSPLFMDAVILSQSGTGQDRIFGDFRFRRYFPGARVAVFPANPISKSHMLPAEIDTYIISSITKDDLQLDRNLDNVYANGQFLVVPLIDLELVLAPSLQQLTDVTSQVTLTLNEVTGKNALPPSFTGNLVDGWEQELGLPVLEIDPDWTNGINTTYRRYGKRRVEGRGTVVVPEGDRYVQVQDFALKLDRPDFWRVLNLFDSRRGRTDLFWEIDREEIWTVTLVSAQVVEITAVGVFTDFSDDFTDHLGIVMNDGTIHIREINSFSVFGGSWRLGLVSGNDLPAIDVAEINRFSRARQKRFDSDAMTERWHTTETVEMQFATVEVLNEKEVDI